MRWAGRLAWAACGFALALVLAALAFVVLNRSTPGTTESPVADAIFGTALLTFPTVGALVASRRPENSIGWIFAGLGVTFAIAAFAGEYAVYALLTEPGSLPAGEAMAWLQSWLFLAPLILAGTLLLLLFPNGHLPSRRWLPVLWFALVGIALGLIGEMFTPHVLEGFESVENPYAVGGAGAENVLEWVANVAFIVMFGAIVASAVSLVVRFRRARGLERQQLKWVASAAGLVGVAFASGPLLFWWLGDVGDAGWEPFLLFSVAAIPVAAGIAILRYRLYEIDRIVNRAVVYGAATAGLAGLYFGLVVALQQIFSSFAGGSDLAIAGSTLAVAALFRPARRWIQGLVDRRFYRHRYDAQRTLDAFAARLREEVDLAQLGSELRSVVAETMQPAHVSLWILPAGEALTPAVTISGRSPGTKELR
jgi:hypothetical protein